MTKESERLLGLSTNDVQQLQERYGKNLLTPCEKESFLKKVIHIISEPMFLLLIVAAVIYFLLGEPRDGAIMLVFVIGIISIDVIQEWKTDKTLNALKDLSAPRIDVIRDGEKKNIASEDLVPKDIMLITEGIKIPADGIIKNCSDLCVDESSLTGEALGVWKIPFSAENDSFEYWRKDYCYAGTLVTQGTGVIEVEKIGFDTEYGKIGTNVLSAPKELSPLHKQTRILVKICAIIAAILFVLVGIITFINISDHQFGERIIESILSGITLAMAMIPEEFPVVLTVFLSMGAWRLAKKNSLVRKLPAVETLGEVSVLCVDKTGTITMNQMTVEQTVVIHGNEVELCRVMGMACETEAYDPMEKAMLHYCEEMGLSEDELFHNELMKEYAFTNELKMMGHVYRGEDSIIITAKGSPEKILTLCNLSKLEQREIQEKINAMTSVGLRVIAIGHMNIDDDIYIPSSLTECHLNLDGFVGLADPPRESIKEDIRVCYKAGVRIVMITGDNGNTASSIACRIGMKNCNKIITGDMLNDMSDEKLRNHVKSVNIFSRVIPEHKMRIVKALKENGEIVAMTGDGVNDAPALKYADIGIAMGRRGSEVSREAADIILLDDNFSTIVDTIRDGRRIYDNIKKAVGYIFTIHIPIAFVSLLAPLLKIAPGNLLLLPLHVVLLELIIDPTCSIVLERQPAEKGIMERKPRIPSKKILTLNGLLKSIIQGFVIFIASFGTYYYLLKMTNYTSEMARTMGLGILMFANLFLVQVNSSNTELAIHSLKQLIKDKVMWAVNIGTVIGFFLISYTPLSGYLKLEALNTKGIFVMLGIAFLSVIWYEIVKLAKRR